MKNIKMILTNAFAPDVRVYKEARYLAEKGFDVEILCWDRENAYLDRETEILEGIRIRRFFPYSEYGTGLKQLGSFIKFINECRNYLKDKKYEYIHCHDLDGVIAGYFARQNHARLIFDMHEFYEVNGKKQKIRYIVRWVVNYFQNKSDYIIYVNEIQSKFMLNCNKIKLVYLPNYPDSKNYIGCKKKQSNKLRISYIGAVRQYNQLKNLIDACKDMDDVMVYIHGEGVDYKKLNAIKNDYNNVIVSGKYDFSESVKLFNETDLLYALYPVNNIQNITGYPVKLFETIITRTPIVGSVGTSLGGFIKEHDIGFVVDGSDVGEIRELIMRINQNRKILNDKIKNLQKIQFDYNWDEVVVNLDEIYD